MLYWVGKHDSKHICPQVCRWPCFLAFKTFLLCCSSKAEEVEFSLWVHGGVRLWVFCCRKAVKEQPSLLFLSSLLFQEDSLVLMLLWWLDMRLKGAEVEAGVGELVASRQTFALLCTVQAAQMYLHYGRVVPKSSFECRLISWVDSDEGINIYSARSSKLYCTFIFLIQVTLKD